MTDTPNRKACPKCGGPVQGGHVDETAFVQSQIIFVVPGEPTHKSFVAAVVQGMRDSAPDRRYALRGLRCADCGFIELFADESLD